MYDIFVCFFKPLNIKYKYKNHSHYNKDDENNNNLQIPHGLH